MGIGVDEQVVIDKLAFQVGFLTFLNFFGGDCVRDGQDENTNRGEALLAVNDNPLPGTFGFANNGTEEVLWPFLSV